VEALTVWTFATPQGAEAALPRIQRLAIEHEIVIADAAVVWWPPGSRKPSVRTLGSLVGPGMLWDGAWGVLLGLVFVVPIAGPVFGAAAGAFAGGLADFGVDDGFVKRTRDTVTAGTSALFAFSRESVARRISDELHDADPSVVRLSPEQARRLREALGEESRPSVA